MYGKEIQLRMQEMNKTIREVASEIGVSSTEILKIKNDQRNLLQKDIFLSLMKCLELNPLEFGGFARLDIQSKYDFVDGRAFIHNINEMIEKNDIKYYQIAEYVGFTVAQISRILHGEKTTIPIDQLAKLCEFFHLSFQSVIVDQDVVPSFWNQKDSFIEENIFSSASKKRVITKR